MPFVGRHHNRPPLQSVRANQQVGVGYLLSLAAQGSPQFSPFLPVGLIKVVPGQ